MSETTLIAAEVDQCAMCRVVFGDPATEYRTVDCSEGEALWRFQAAVALGDRCKVQRLACRRAHARADDEHPHRGRGRRLDSGV